MILLLLHAAATLYMAGLIWFVQLVHYPLMAKVGHEHYDDYQRHHERRTTLAVAPAMILEMATAVWLVMATPEWIAPWLTWLGLGLLILIWLSTALLQVPCHKKLGVGFDETAHRKLVASNWIRTALWSIRCTIVLWMPTAGGA